MTSRVEVSTASLVEAAGAAHAAVARSAMARLMNFMVAGVEFELSVMC